MPIATIAHRTAGKGLMRSGLRKMTTHKAASARSPTAANTVPTREALKISHPPHKLDTNHTTAIGARQSVGNRAPTTSSIQLMSVRLRALSILDI